MANKIEHLVVLMMENRSFDHMFGFLKSPSWKIDGLDGTETNPDTSGAPVRVTPNARHAGDLTPDPGHDFISVNEQIFGNSQGTGNGPFMKGFVKNYHGKTSNVAKSHRVMRCFGPGQLPILPTLAKEYAVCDRWFCSVPGPTLPNRAFAFGATSLGRVDMNPNYLALKTIFERLNENGVSSKIYYTDWTIGLAVGFLLQNTKKFLFFFDDFIKDCKKNKLPAFSFVEPRFNDFSVSGGFFPAADQHPDHNMLVGERVIKAVYDAIASNKSTWESTLLVITYDEHGGLYDHVKPPATVNPGDRPPGTTVFDFDRLGVRVPAVLVSPFIPAGTIVHDRVFDHTSIIATTRKLFISNFANSFLTERDRQANTFEDVLTLANPRTPIVKFPKLGAAPSAGAQPLTAFASESTTTAKAPKRPTVTDASNDFQAAMVQQAFILEGSLPRSKQTGTLVSAIKTEQETAEYLAEIRAKILKARNGGAKRKKSKTRGSGALVKCLLFLLTLLPSYLSASAQTPATTPPGVTAQNQSSCAGLEGTARCLYRFYDKITSREGFHLATGSVVPGSGFAAGPGYKRKKPFPSWQLDFNSSARVSIRKYWELDANLRLTKTGLDPSAPADLGSLKMNFYGQVKDAPRLDFFGLGPESREQDRAVYHYREAVVGADLSKPLTRWLDVGGAVEWIWPDIITISNPTVNSVERAFNETTAPGITSQTAFFHLAGFAGLHSRGQPESRKLEYRFFYHLYQNDPFSFRRFEADLRNKFPFGKNELRIRGRFSFSDTSSGNRVPFYLMETLGGSNIRGADTLRGFRDYRFRDRNLFLIQTEYLRQLYGPIDFIVFYDTGKVAPSLNRFDQGRLRHTYGLGIVVVPRRGENVLFRFYVALGSGEGNHTFFGLGDLLGGRADRLLR